MFMLHVSVRLNTKRVHVYSMWKKLRRILPHFNSYMLFILDKKYINTHFS